MSEIEVYPVNGRSRCDSSMCGNAAEVTIRMNFGGKTLFQSKKVDYCMEHFKAFLKKATKEAAALGVKVEELVGE